MLYGLGTCALKNVVGEVRERHVLVHDVRRGRIEPVDGNLIVRELVAADRIDDRLGDRGEIARTFGGRGNYGGAQKRGGGLAQPGVSAEEEGLILDDGAAERSAELVAVQRRLDQALNVLAFNFVLRRNSNKEPWKLLVPERVMTLITPLPKRPYSAL